MRAAIPNPSYKYQANNASGFTLIELMVTIAVLAIIVSIAAPNVSTQLANQRVKATAATIENALKEAKAESIIRRQSLSFTYNNNGTNAGTVVIAQGATVLASYSYSAKSTVSNSASKTTITFEPTKRVDALTYTICDSNTDATPYQVIITNVANITTKTNAGATC